jgi:hypothetical protein
MPTKRERLKAANKAVGDAAHDALIRLAEVLAAAQEFVAAAQAAGLVLPGEVAERYAALEAALGRYESASDNHILAKVGRDNLRGARRS